MNMNKKQRELSMNSVEAPKRKDGKSDFNAVVKYIRNDLKTGEDVWAIECDSIGTAALEMEAIARLNTRCKDPIYHFILTWPDDEKPTPKQAKEAAEIAIKRLGFDTSGGGNQAVIGLHKDTDNWHLDIAVNKVNQSTLRSHSPEWSRTTMNEACREIEEKQGWSIGKGLAEFGIDESGKKVIQKSDYRNEENKGISSKIQDKERHTGTVSFARYVKETVGPDLKNAIKKDASWKSLHDTLNKFDVKIVERKSGFSIVDKHNPDEHFAAASTAGSFAKGANLTKKIGDFKKNKDHFSQPLFKYNKENEKGVEAIEQAAKVRSPNRKSRVKNKEELSGEKDLSNQFNNEKARRKTEYASAKKAAIKKLSGEKKEAKYGLSELLKEKRATVFEERKNQPEADQKSTKEINAILRGEKIALTTTLNLANKKKDANLKIIWVEKEKEYKKNVTWHQFLSRVSKEKHEHSALAKKLHTRSSFRNQTKRIDEEKTSTLQPAFKSMLIVQIIDIRQIVISASLKKDGYHAKIKDDHIAYGKKYGETDFKDYGHRVIIDNHSDESVRAAVRLAAEKFDVVKSSGSVEFQAKAALAAAELGIKFESDNADIKKIYDDYSKDLEDGIEPDLETKKDAVKSASNSSFDVEHVRYLFNHADISDAKGTKSITKKAGIYSGDTGVDSKAINDETVAFAHRNKQRQIIGFELENANGSWYSKRGQKGIYIANDSDECNRIVIVNSALEAEAASKLDTSSNILYVSTSNSMSKHQVEIIKEMKKDGVTIEAVNMSAINENKLKVEFNDLELSKRDVSFVDEAKSKQREYIKSNAVERDDSRNMR